MKTLHRIGIFPLIICLVLTSIPVAWAIEIVRQKNVATYVMFPIVNQTGATITSASGLDSEMDAFADGTAPDGFADCANEATEIGSTGIYRLLLNQTEMNNDYIYVKVKSSSTGAVPQHILIRTIVGDPLNIATTDDGGTINVTTGAIDTVAAVTTVNGIANDAITAAAIATDAIGAAEIAADAIGASEIAADAIGASEIAANAITTAELATGCISSDEVADNAIDAGAIATDAITAAKIAADAIGASEIATNAIGAAEIAASAITSSEAPALQYLTGDAYVRLGAPAGASTAADIAAIKSDTAAVLVDTAAMDTSAELRTLLCGSDTAISTYAGADTSGTTTLLDRLTATRAGYLDYLNTINGKLPTNYIMGSAVQTDKDDDIDAILVDTAAMDTANELRTLLTGGTTALSVLTAADIWQTDLSGYSTSGYAGTYLKGAGGAADPWLATVPGSYAVGTAGYVIGNWAEAPADPWDVELPGSYTGNKAGKILKRILDDTGYIAAK